MQIHLVAYGDFSYHKQKQIFIKQAAQSYFFSKIHSFSPNDIDPVFRFRIYDPLKYSRGGGYWIWKPYFVKKVMDSISFGDILIYSDSGCEINKDGRQRFKDYIDLLLSSRTGTLDFELYHKEYKYTKQEVFDYYKCPNEVINSNQLHSTVLLLKKCQHTIKLINEWYLAAVKYPFLFTDERRVLQRPVFLDHRHDQSIFSVLRKGHGATIITDETCYYDYETGSKFPFWAMRHK